MNKMVKYVGLDVHKDSITIAIANQGRSGLHGPHDLRDLLPHSGGGVADTSVTAPGQQRFPRIGVDAKPIDSEVKAEGWPVLFQGLDDGGGGPGIQGLREPRELGYDIAGKD